MLQDLKIIRIKKSLTQKDIADKLGIAPNSYTKIENGNNPFSVNELKELKKVFNISDSEFMEIFFK